MSMDSIGTTYVYLFAAITGLFTSVILNVKAGKVAHGTGSRYSAFVGMMGTGFAFAAAPFSGIHGDNDIGKF